MHLFAGLLRRLVSTAALVHRLLALTLALLRLATLVILAWAAMPAAAVPAVTVLPVAILAVAVLLLAAVVLAGILLRRTATGDERRQAADVARVLPALLGLRLVVLMLRPRLVLLILVIARLMVLLILIRLMLVIRLLILLRIVRLILSVRADPVIVTVVEAVVAAALRHALLRLLLALLVLIVVRILLAELFLRRRDQPEVMLRVLIVVFGRDRITGALRIARELDVFLCDVGGRAANFHVGAVGLVNPCQRILALATMAAAAPHALLTVSHGVSVRQPLIDCGLRRDLANLKVPRTEAKCAAARHPPNIICQRRGGSIARWHAQVRCYLLCRNDPNAALFRSLAYLW